MMGPWFHQETRYSLAEDDEFVFTGARLPEIEQMVEQQGGSIYIRVGGIFRKYESGLFVYTANSQFLYSYREWDNYPVPACVDESK